MDDLGGKTPLFLETPIFPNDSDNSDQQKNRLELIGGYRLHLEGWRTGPDPRNSMEIPRFFFKVKSCVESKLNIQVKLLKHKNCFLPFSCFSKTTILCVCYGNLMWVISSFGIPWPLC